MYMGICSNLSHLRVTSCVAYCHIPEVKRNKIYPKAKSIIKIGYNKNNKAYRYYHSTTRKILIDINVKFGELNIDRKELESTKLLID